MIRIGLSPPLRRANPPANNTLGISVIAAFTLALVTCGFFLGVFEVLVVNDPFFARQGDKALAARPADQRQSHLSREIDAPGRKSGTRDKDGDAHPHRFDHHLLREPASGVENLIGGIDTVAVDPACDLIDRIVAANVLGVADGRALLT